MTCQLWDSTSSSSLKLKDSWCSDSQTFAALQSCTYFTEESCPPKALQSKKTKGLFSIALASRRCCSWEIRSPETKQGHFFHFSPKIIMKRTISLHLLFVMRQMSSCWQTKKGNKNSMSVTLKLSLPKLCFMKGL